MEQTQRSCQIESALKKKSNTSLAVMVLESCSNAGQALQSGRTVGLLLWFQFLWARASIDDEVEEPTKVSHHNPRKSSFESYSKHSTEILDCHKVGMHFFQNRWRFWSSQCRFLIEEFRMDWVDSLVRCLLFRFYLVFQAVGWQRIEYPDGISRHHWDRQIPIRSYGSTGTNSLHFTSWSI